MDQEHPNNQSRAAVRYQRFSEFWPFYVQEHSSARNRRLHFIGTSLGFVLLFLAAFTERPMLLVAALVSGYAFAWVGHFFVEHNRPATFKYPLYSLMADWKMFYLMLNGRMEAEIERLKIPKDRS